LWVIVFDSLETLHCPHQHISQRKRPAGIRAFLVFLLCALVVGSHSTPTRAEASRPTVYVFLAEGCPVCQFYTLRLRELQQEFGAQVRWVAVFPNRLSTDSSALQFLLTHDLAMQIRLDPELVFCKVYGVTTTPEVVVKDERNRLRYRGRIDDRYYAPGKRRQQVTRHDLLSVLQRILKGEEFTFQQTEAIGCLLNNIP
jgi:thiol-disulfide isomerase/thioredoxin